MCGINGFNWQDESLIKRMNFITRHRGPDGIGTYIDEKVSIGHNRLAIIDLSENGRQPMPNEDGDIWIVLNGEIYNFEELRAPLEQTGHKFRSRTDTEVILHGWEEYGPAVFDRLKGMWAFCIYDKRRNQIVLCRDRFGIKPLYYSFQNGKFVFSSMISAILAHHEPARANEKAIMQYLAFNLEQHNEFTFFEGINSLLPGHYLVFDLNNNHFQINKWYRPAARKIADSNQLRDIFIKSVTSHTVSDVPVGVCLSGGVDSSAITCVMAKSLPYQFNTYSLVMPGLPKDESKYIHEIGRLVNARQFFTELDEKEFLDCFNEFIYAMEEPVTGLSAYAQYRVFHMAKENGAKVLLDGQGGDELFGGYVYYFAFYYLELLKKMDLVKLVDEMIQYRRNFREFYPHLLFLFLLIPNFIRDFLWKKFVISWLNHSYVDKIIGQERDPRWKRMGLRECLEKTLFSTSIPHNLVWEDKSAMHWSIESRVPFLDVDLAEASMSLRTDQLLNKGRTKWMIKQALEGLLPGMIVERKDKIGFEAPMERFFQHADIIDFARTIIYSDSFKNRPYWNWKKVEKIFNDHLNHKKDAGSLIWKWINLEMWLRCFIDQNPFNGGKTECTATD